MNSISLKSIIFLSIASILYLILAAIFLGFKTDQLFIVAFVNIPFYASASSRKFILGFSIFVIFWIIFDFMKAFPNYNFASIHIEDLYNREKKWFGINDNGIMLTPNEYFAKHTMPLLDVIAGFFYLNWVPVPMAFAIYLFFFKSRRGFLEFALSFLFVNVIGFTVYYIYPAAPPWYVELNGFNVNFHSPTSAAGLLRFDDFFGIHLFGNMYVKSSNVFAAMPSLHSAYPVIAFYYGLKNKMSWLNIYFFIMMLGIWFGAVYTSHHYIQDVLAGIACAFTGIFIFQKVLLKTKRFSKFISAYEKIIS